MLRLDVRQIRILNELFKQDFVDAKQFMVNLFISLRTLQIEIKVINDELGHGNYPFEIANSRGRGYYLNYEESKREIGKMVMKQCTDYLENSPLFTYRNSPRVFSILRLLLASQDYLKSYDIASYLHISNATFTKDMKIVRAVLCHYDISLISVPYYGMKISGNELSIRNCMIDFCDVYSLEEETPIFYEISLEEYGFTRKELLENVNLLRNMLMHHDMRVSDISFRRLVVYLMILRNRIGANKGFANEKDFVGLKELDFARDVLLELKITNDDEVFGLCCFLVSACHNNVEITQENYPNLYSQVEESFSYLNQTLIQKNNLDLRQYEGVKSKLLTFLLKRLIRKKYSLITQSICSSIYEMYSYLPASYALTKQILFILNRYEIERDAALISDLFMVIYNTVFVIPNKYKPVDVLVINRHGELSAESLKYRLAMENYNLNYHFSSVYELHNIDWKQYICAILIKPTTMDAKKCPIPLFEYGYFTNFREIRRLWERVIMKQQRDSLIFPQLSQFNMAENTVEDIEEICEILVKSGLDFENLSKYIVEEIYNNVRFGGQGKRAVIVYSSSEMCTRMFHFKFKKKQIINNEWLEEIGIVVLDLQNNILTIKQGDSALRRVFNNEVDIIA